MSNPKPVAIVNVERPGNIEWLAEPTPDDGAMLYAEPQPPALGGDAVMRLEAEKLIGGDGEYAVDFVKPGWLMSCREAGGTFYLYSQDHVARLQAEVDLLTVQAENDREANTAIRGERDHYKAEAERLTGLARKQAEAMRLIVVKRKATVPEIRSMAKRAFNESRAALAEGAPVTPCAHEWTDDGQFLLACTKCGAQEDRDPHWRPVETAPRDGTMLRLLVEFEEHSTEDDQQAPTIGANNFDNDGDDDWKFAGWCWTHDHFVQGKGLVVGWLPMLDNKAEGAQS